jgi:hypothetical protein
VTALDAVKTREQTCRYRAGLNRNEPERTCISAGILPGQGRGSSPLSSTYTTSGQSTTSSWRSGRAKVSLVATACCSNLYFGRRLSFGAIVARPELRAERSSVAMPVASTVSMHWRRWLPRSGPLSARCTPHLWTRAIAPQRLSATDHWNGSSRLRFGERLPGAEQALPTNLFGPPGGGTLRSRRRLVGGSQQRAALPDG